MNISLCNLESSELQEVCDILWVVYVNGGYTAPETAIKIFVPEELRKRGPLLIARSEEGKIVGSVVFASPTNPYRQIATQDEAELQLLAVLPECRKKGIASELCQTFEKLAMKKGFRKIVLSSQETMSEAHKIYEKLHYQRNPSRDWFRGERRFYAYEKVIP